MFLFHTGKNTVLCSNSKFIFTQLRFRTSWRKRSFVSAACRLCYRFPWKKYCQIAISLASYIKRRVSYRTFIQSKVALLWCFQCNILHIIHFVPQTCHGCVATCILNTVKVLLENSSTVDLGDIVSKEFTITTTYGLLSRLV